MPAPEDKVENKSLRYADLLAACAEMAGDREREAEAKEWCEALVGDAFDEDGREPGS